MIIETNLIDISKVTLDNPSSWNKRIKYEIPRQWGTKIVKNKIKPKTSEERKQALKIYQHNYYLEVTKPKRKQKRGVLDE